MSTTATPSAPRAGRREWTGLAVLVLPALLASMDLSILFTALPRISAELHPSATQQLWISDIYGFLLAGLLITMGALGDRIGRRRLLLIGGALFGAASALAAYVPTAEALIAARALLGAGGAVLAPSTLALIRDMFRDERQRGVAVGVWTAAFTGGIAVGPILGGVLLEYFWWGSVFLINVPVMALLLVLGPLLLPESADPRASRRFDLLSAALSMAAVLPVVYGVKELAAHGAAAAPVAAIAAGLALGAVFVRRQYTLPDPLIDVGLFRRGAFSASVGVSALLTFSLVGFGLQAVQYLQLVQGISPLPAALLQVPTAVGTVAGIALATRAVRRVPPGTVVGTGLLVSAAGFALLTLVRVDSSVLLVMGSYTVLTLGVGMAMALANAMVIGSAPPERAGAAAAVSETGAELGGALGIAILGSVATAAYRSGVAGEVPPGLPPEAADAAGETLGGAVAAAEHLPGPAAEALLEGARQAFTSGLDTLALVGAAVLVVAAAAAFAALRGVTPATDPDGPR
ncbi:MFS transporter [Streptomonospora nanhaiensis]|uniref:MFS transporter n=1 Tax=Streptomonospora nanhaiensis TaxID=1323731 RepID=UPI001C990453|nr:MFS transporter [Streptomonospora nanhaiensis]MBX9391855.1 MFS transporter [Streptomonospora nanhaiensis]